jgi:hypothetical protein
MAGGQLSGSERSAGGAPESGARVPQNRSIMVVEPLRCDGGIGALTCQARLGQAS